MSSAFINPSITYGPSGISSGPQIETITAYEGIFTNLLISGTINGTSIADFVISTGTIATNAVVKGYNGTGTVTPSGVFIDSSNNVTGVNSITVGTATAANYGVNTNLVTTIGPSDDMNIVSKGGIINVTSLIDGGVRMITINNNSSANWAAFMAYVSGADLAAVCGTYYNNEWMPAIGGNNTGFTLWSSFWINFGQTPGTQCVIVGNASSGQALANGNGFYVVGNMESTGNLRGPSVVTNSILFNANTTLTSASTSAITLTLPSATGNLVESTSSLTANAIVVGGGAELVQSSDVSISSTGAITGASTIAASGDVSAAGLILNTNTTISAPATTAITLTLPSATGSLVESAAALTANAVVVGGGAESLQSSDVSISSTGAITGASTIATSGNITAGGNILATEAVLNTNTTMTAPATSAITLTLPSATGTLLSASGTLTADAIVVGNGSGSLQSSDVSISSTGAITGASTIATSGNITAGGNILATEMVLNSNTTISAPATSAITLTLPSATGTLALTSDLKHRAQFVVPEVAISAVQTLRVGSIPVSNIANLTVTGGVSFIFNGFTGTVGCDIEDNSGTVLASMTTTTPSNPGVSGIIEFPLSSIAASQLANDSGNYLHLDIFIALTSVSGGSVAITGVYLDFSSV